MEQKVLKNKKLDDMNEKKRINIRRFSLITIVVILFSGVAIWSMILENQNRGATIQIRPDSSQDISDNFISTADSIESRSYEEITLSEDGDFLPVYLVGEVINPGIYKIKPGIFLYQLVEMAGGLTSKAAKNSINLAYQIKSNQMIRIPSIEELARKEIPEASVDILEINNGTMTENTKNQDASAKININTATESELDQLPGIGAATAKLIIDFRTQNGNFKKIDDLMKVPGIKENKFAQIKDRITV